MEYRQTEYHHEFFVKGKNVVVVWAEPYLWRPLFIDIVLFVSDLR